MEYLKSPAVELRELPIPGCGVRVVSVEELASRCAVDPLLREAIDAMSRAAGAPAEVKQIIHKQLVKDMRTERRAESQRRAIEYGMRKQRVIDAHQSTVAA